MMTDVGVLPLEHEPLFGGGDLLGLICPELGVTPLVDPGTDVEDERLRLSVRRRLSLTGLCLCLRHRA